MENKSTTDFSYASNSIFILFGILTVFVLCIFTVDSDATSPSSPKSSTNLNFGRVVVES